jgi:chlorobactene glucosyltransferase
MLYQLIIAFFLIGFAVNLSLNLRSLKRPQVKKDRLKDPPMVSILIPARNEEANIKKCLESLSHQDYVNLEVLVLDDNSSDTTAAIVCQMAAADSRIKLLPGEQLAEGWAGKPFACYQLAKKARGRWLLFVDADTIHEPQMLSSVISLAIENKPALLSGFPRQIATSLPQKVAIPVLYFVILSWLPLWWLQHTRKPRPSLAIGQFLLFRADDYWKMDGHHAVKSRILEDVWLGIETTRRGGRHMAVDLSQLVSCEMYRNVGVMREGFIRWIYSVAVLSPLAMISLLTAALVFYLAPYYWLWRGFASDAYSGLWHAIIIFQVTLILVMRWRLDSRFREPQISTILHPFGLTFLMLTACQATFRMITGAGVYWKKRLYDKNSCVE